MLYQAKSMLDTMLVRDYTGKQNIEYTQETRKTNK